MGAAAASVASSSSNSGHQNQSDRNLLFKVLSNFKCPKAKEKSEVNATVK